MAAAEIKVPAGFQIDQSPGGLPPGFEMDSDRDTSVWGGVKKMVSDPGQYLDDRKTALAASRGLLEKRDAGLMPAAEPVENFGTTGAAPLLATTGGGGIQTVYDSSFAANGVIPSASMGSRATAVAARAPIARGAGMLRDTYQTAKPYLKSGVGLYVAKKLGLL